MAPVVANSAANIQARHMSSDKLLTLESMNQHARKMEYAVRGEIVILAEKIREELAKGVKHNFDEIVMFNIGNPQACGQLPITFYRQVLSLVEYPDLLNHPDVGKMFPSDAIARAKSMVAGNPNGTGAYSDSRGVRFVRDNICDFLQQRDGYPADPNNIYLTNGASTAIQLCMQTILDGNDKNGFMIPIPQYPIYTALLALMNTTPVGYEVNEAKGWKITVDELEKRISSARSNGTDVRALVVINPGNPTGNCLTMEEIQDIIRFCKKENLLLLADEVYQENVYAKGMEFCSFKKALCSLGDDFKNFELFSFHSISKGMLGECGHRGGYMECTNIDPAVEAEIYKLASSGLCSNIPGQLLVDLMVNGPKPGDESYELFRKEYDSIFNRLQRASSLIAETLNGLQGVSCNTPEGSMYAFPSITLPAEAVEAAKAAGKAPDTFYCLSLLQHAGLCVVPGSGFGQADGTWHFRITFLPPEDKIEAAMSRLAEHHNMFLSKYGGLSKL